jgi:hypothetical protein
MSEPIKHHYLPVFYLSQWAGPDGKLTRYYRPHLVVVGSRIAPANTGYEPGLYSLEGYQPEFINAVEKEYMAKVVDEPASKALKIVLGGEYSKMTPELQVAWTRFLMSLMFRTPQMIDYITKEAEQNLRRNFQSNPEDYESVRAATHPPTLMEFVERYSPTLFSEAGKSFLPGIIDSAKMEMLFLKWDGGHGHSTASNTFLIFSQVIVPSLGLMGLGTSDVLLLYRFRRGERSLRPTIRERSML